MRAHFVPIVLLVMVLVAPAHAAREIRGPVAPPRNVVNAVIGDVSFVEAFGRLPDASDGEDVRVGTHLRYVEDLLRRRDVSHLRSDQQVARERVLDLLRDYHLAGEFPRNRDLSMRRPVFVDEVTGAVCAVGHLMAETVGPDVVAAVDHDYHFASVFQIDTPALDDWLDTHGLTRVEAAMIQPFYSDLVEVSIDNPGHITVFPDGSGGTLANEGHTVRVRLEDGNGDPVVGYPFQDLWLGTLGDDGTFAACPGGTVADANTDAEGTTTFSAAPAAGGWAEDGLYVFVAGATGGRAALDLTVNSPDVNGDLRVDLVDVALFAQDFLAGYAFRSDIANDADGRLNIADVGILALGLGSECE